MKIFKTIWHSPKFRSELRQNRERLYRLAYSWCHDAHLADDLVQDTLSKALRKADQLRETDMVDRWLCKILANCWRDYLRAVRDVTDVDSVALVERTTPEHLYGRQQIVTSVRAAVERLPMGQRQVLTLVDLEDMTYAEVAEVLGIPVGTVMSRISRARAALKQHLLAPGTAQNGKDEQPAKLRRVK